MFWLHYGYKGAVFCSQSALRHEFFKLSGYFCLSIGIEMAIGVQGGLDAFVAQPLLEELRRYVHFNQGCRVAVPLRYNYDKPEESRNIKGFQGFKPDF